MRILIIEDELNLADVISSRMKKENYIVAVFLFNIFSIVTSISLRLTGKEIIPTPL